MGLGIIPSLFDCLARKKLVGLLVNHFEGIHMI